MRIAHCQFETWNGEFERNLKRVGEGLSRAEIISFGLSKSAWSHCEFGALLNEAMKENR